MSTRNRRFTAPRGTAVIATALLSALIPLIAGSMASARPPQGFHGTRAMGPDPRPSGGDEDRGPAQTSASPTPSPTPSGGSSVTPAPQPSSSPPQSPPPAELAVATSSRELLVQVGDVIHYRVTVTNNASETAEDVAIHNDVPPEVDVISVPISPDADAIQLGRTPEGEDIDWVVNDLEAGRSLTFTWTGRAAAAGDLAATNRVQARAATGPAATASAATFLGVREGITTDNPKPEPIMRKEVVLGTRIVSSAPGAPGSVLPVTGFDPSRFLSVAALLIAGGFCLVAIARMQNRRVSWTVTSIALVAVMTACVSTSDEPSARAPQDIESPAAQDGEDESDEKAPKDRVKGKRIVREDPDGSVDEPGFDITAPTEGPVFETFRRVRIVEVAPEDLAVAELDSRPGDNAMSYSWDQAAGITQAASSIRFVEDAPASIITGLDVGARGIDVDVTLTNLSEDERLAVRGRIVHVVTNGSGEIARFESEEIDILLEPNGSTRIGFEYLLPSGDYGASSLFEAS